MKCLSCGRWSFKIVCKECTKLFLEPSPSFRILSNGLRVDSFYNYDEIAPFLHTKHTVYGSKVFKILAKKSFLPFAKNFKSHLNIFAIAVDDGVKDGYSHTAILSNELKNESIKPLFGTLRAKSSFKYSGKSLEYRKAHPREFECKVPKDSYAILIDDLVTTGSTLVEASQKLKNEGVETLFALTLANANNY